MAFQGYYHNGTVMQRIEELRKWQCRQQDKLLRQQEEQRLLLSNEQQRMYKVFGLQNNDGFCEQPLSTNPIEAPPFGNRPCEKGLESNKMLNVGTDVAVNICANHIKSKFPSTNGYAAKMEEYNPETSSPPQCVMKETTEKILLSLDETPVVSVRKDFNQLLQEKLEQYDGGDNNHNAATIDKENKPKKKFLKKGEGLARFCMKPIKFQPSRQNTAKTNIISKQQPHISKDSVPKSNQSKDHSINSTSHKTRVAKSLKGSYPKTAVPKLSLKSRKTSPLPATWANILHQNQLESSMVQSIQQETEVFENSTSKDCIELSFLEKMKDADKRNKKEVEELKIFEQLEQHAANSSFCSTSSLVARLMENSRNSTPVKNHSFSSIDNQNENFTTSLHNSYSPKDCHMQEQMLSSSLQLNNKNTVSGYLPYGLDNSDENTIDGEMESDGFKCDVYESSRKLMSKLSVGSNRQYEAVSEQLGTGTFNSNIKINSPNNRYLRVRFAETNEYKSVSDGDTSFSSQGDTSRNISVGNNCEHYKPNSTSLEANVIGKHFQDDQAWSDDCSCTSSEESRSTDISVSATEQSLIMDDGQNNLLQSPKQLSQHQMANQQHEVYSMITNTNKFPADLDKSHLANNSSNDHHVEDQEMTNIGLTTQSKNSSEIVFKSSLLRTRLEELEKEIEIFRKENANLQKMKKMHAEDLTRFNKEKKELEKKMSEEKDKMESSFHDERKKLSREKLIFEKYCKDLRNRPTKQEKEEIQTLKQQLSALQEELHKKDSRWSATQVRTRDRLKQLEQENSQLKNEIEKLKKTKSQMKEKSNSSGKSHVVSRTRMLHAVNDHIAKITPNDLEDSIIVHDVVPTRKIPESVLQRLQTPPYRQMKANQPSTTCQTNEWGHMYNKAYQSFLSIPDLKPESSTDVLLTVQDDSKNYVINHRTVKNSSQRSNDIRDEVTSLHKNLDHTSESSEEEDNTENLIDVAQNKNKIHMAIYDAFYYADHKCTKDSGLEYRADAECIPKTDSSQQVQDLQNNESIQETTQTPENIYKCTGVNGNLGDSDYVSMIGSEVKNTSLPSSDHNFNTSHLTIPDLPLASSKTVTQNSNTEEACHSAVVPLNTIVKPSANREKVYPDGRKEIWYPNGNLKKVSADGSLIKMIYYNGDVKETLNDGTVKYFYAETKTWHTAYTDGLEILEYADGQMERRQKDGTKEVTYPNTTVRTCFPNGLEEWIFQDGLVVKVDIQLGERVLLLPNGQREVHTKEHKRREYPDGTVKFVYPDGIQETRYANGRVRVKDKDGNLIMDSVMQRL